MATSSPEPGEIDEQGNLIHEQLRAQGVKTLNLRRVQPRANTRNPKYELLEQKHAVESFQKFHNRFGRDKAEYFFSRLADEQFRREIVESQVAFDLESVEIANPMHEQSRAQNPEESEDEDTALCEVCLCVKCRKRKRKPEKLQQQNEVFRSFIKNAARSAETLIKNYWVDLEAGFTNVIGSSTAVGTPRNIVCLNRYLALRQMDKDDELQWLKRALALLRNLQLYEDYLSEEGYTIEEQQDHLESQTARNKYIIYIYQGKKLNNTDEKKARKALTEQLRYGRRWKIFVRVLTVGFLLACGRDLAKKVIQRTCFTTEFLQTLANQIKVSDLSRLCILLKPLGDQLLENDRLDAKQNDRRSVLSSIKQH